MMRVFFGVTILACLVFSLGCNQGPSVDDFKKLQDRVADLESKAALTELFQNMEGIAYLTPGSNGYAVVRSDIGTITVSLEDIRAYANGSKIALQFGNTTAATINGFNAKLEWGMVDKNGVAVNEKAKSRKVEFSETLHAGAWTRASVVLDGVPPTELGFVRVRELGHTGINLRAR